MQEINIKLLNEDAKVPTRGSEYAAGYDLYANIPVGIALNPFETKMIPTGFSIELPENTFGAIVARSGLASKKGLAPANKFGVIDADYRGPVMVALHNHSNEVQVIDPGERIAQLIIMPYIPVEFNQVDELSETVRGGGGFGSTGSN